MSKKNKSGGLVKTLPVEKAKDIKGTTKRLLSYLKPFGWHIAAALLAILASTLLTIGATRFIGIAIDNYIAVLDFTGLAKICTALLTAYVLSSICIWLQANLMITAAQGAVFRIREEAFEKFQRLPLRYFDSMTHGELMSRLTNDVDNISNALNGGISEILQSILTISITFVVMMTLSPLLTLVSIITVPLLMLAAKVVSKQSKKYFSKRQERLGDLNGFIEETISGQKVVKVFSREEEVIEEFREKNKKLLHVSIQAEIFSGVIGPLSVALNSLSYTLVVTVGAIIMAIGGTMTLGTISNFILYSRQFTRPLNELASMINTLMSALAGAERVFEILDEDTEPTDDKDAKTLVDIKGHVLISDVDFSYNKGEAILKSINLYAKPGQTIAFVGPTGAGKTTIINLLTRFYDIDKGSISIDGMNIQHIHRDSLREALGIVLQDTYLFTGTIADNIRYGRLAATDEEVKEAAKLANAHEFIRHLPHGYETILSDGGGNLSHGQRQMISIARTILKNPAILVLDEATSNVDVRTEVKIQEAMNHLMTGRTSFVIAHRLSTIKNANLIAVIKQGEIIERGDHQELMEQKGFYYNLYMSQFENA